MPRPSQLEMRRDAAGTSTASSHFALSPGPPHPHQTPYHAQALPRSRGSVLRRSASHRMCDRELVDLQQALKAVLWIESLLICLTGMDSVTFIPLRLCLDVGNGQPGCIGVSGLEQHTVDSGTDELDERAMPGCDWRNSQSHGLDRDEPERLLPDGGHNHRTGTGHQVRASHIIHLSYHFDRGPSRSPLADLAFEE